MSLNIDRFLSGDIHLIPYIIVVLFVLTIYIYLQNEWIEIKEYKIVIPNLPKSLDGFKIVQVSDTQFPYHSSSVKKILSIIRAQNPDLIALTGDMIDRRARNLKKDGTIEFCQQVGKISDVYAITGNHEYTSPIYDEWKAFINKTDIRLLMNEHVILEKNGARIALFGLDVDVPYHEDLFVTDIRETKNLPRILLSHKPNLNKSFESDKNSIRPHLVLCGHAHGGQFRIPFWRGLYAPDQGILPRYTVGIYRLKNNVKMLVSRGLGNSRFPFRLNNRPHMPVVILKSNE